jgi:hypothetical protein
MGALHARFLGPAATAVVDPVLDRRADRYARAEVYEADLKAEDLRRKHL